MVKRQIDESNDDEILKIRYTLKADETRNPMKPKSKDLEIRSGRNPCFKIGKKSTPKFGRKDEFNDF